MSLASPAAIAQTTATIDCRRGPKTISTSYAVDTGGQEIDIAVAGGIAAVAGHRPRERVSKARVGKRMNSQSGLRPSVGQRLAIVAVLAGMHLAMLSSGAHAEPTLFLKTNTGSGLQVSFAEYATLADLATNSSSGSTDINPDIPTSSYLFFDGASYYKTVANSGLGSGTNQIVRYGSYQDLATNSSGTTFNFQTGGSQANWLLSDDFFADGLGNYYRNSSPTSSVTQYPSFADLVANTNGSLSNYSGTYGPTDRFFASEGTFYRTATNGTNVVSFVTFASYANLLSGSSSGTTSSVAYGVDDQFIAVPEPSTWALGLCGIVPYLCWAARRSHQQRATLPGDSADLAEMAAISSTTFHPEFPSM